MNKKLLEEAKNKDKKYKLKLISSGFSPHTPNLIKTQKKIDNEILNPTNKKLIDKLDNEIISYVYRDKKNQLSKKKLVVRNQSEKNLSSGRIIEKTREILPSMDVMKNLCHYKIYDYLLQNNFKEFISNNERLEFYNPEKEKNSLYKIQKYLNRKMEIENNFQSRNKPINLYKEKNGHPILLTEVNINSPINMKNKILNLKKTNQEKEYKLLEISSNKNEKQNISNDIKTKNYSSSYKSPLTSSNSNYSFVINKNKEQNFNNHQKTNKKCITYSNYISSVLSGRKNSKNSSYNKKKI